MASEDALTTAPSPTRWWNLRSRWRKLRERLTPRMAAVIVLWRVEVRIGLPLALFLIATMGRWPAAITMGAVTAGFSAASLFLIEGEEMMKELRGWLEKRRFVRRFLLPIADRRDRTGTALRIGAIPFSIMFMSPFIRGVTYNLFHMPRIPAYGLSVGGSIPHSLFWTGIVLGSAWGVAIKPAFQWLWRAVIEPGADLAWDDGVMPVLEVLF